MIGTVPPSTLHAAPVTYAARSEQRKVITEATSSGSARRPSGRPAGDGGEHLVARLAGARSLLVGKAAGVEPRAGRGRAGRDGVAADAVPRVGVGDEPREREHGRLPDRVLGHGGRRPLARGGGHVHDRASAPLLHQRRGGPDGAHVAHHVQVPHRVPVLVRELVEADLARDAHVVDEHVDAAEGVRGVLDDVLGLRPAPRGRRRWRGRRRPPRGRAAFARGRGRRRRRARPRSRAGAPPRGRCRPSSR